MTKNNLIIDAVDRKINNKRLTPQWKLVVKNLFFILQQKLNIDDLDERYLLYLDDNQLLDLFYEVLSWNLIIPKQK